MFSTTPVSKNVPIQQSLRNEWSIELLRGVAALMVILAHYWTLIGVEPGILRFLFTGVDLFFVISGFVFAPYLFGKNLLIIPHLIRRLFRIYPLYVIALITYAGLRLQQGLDADHFLVHLFFLQTLESRDIAFYFNPAFWSLPPEVEFYLVLPLLAFLASDFRRLIVILVVALITHMILAYSSSSVISDVNTSTILSVHLPGLLIEFLLGAVAWFIVTNVPKTYKRVGMLVGGITCWLLLACIFNSLYSSGGDNAVMANPLLRGNMGLFAAIAFTLIVSAFVGWVTYPPMWVRLGAVTLGNLSFGLYLFHNAAPIILRSLKSSLSAPLFAMLCFLLTILMSALLHSICEKPLRNFGRAWANRYMPIPS